MNVRKVGTGMRKIVSKGERPSDKSIFLNNYASPLTGVGLNQVRKTNKLLINAPKELDCEI